MIGISRLWIGQDEASDSLRYGRPTGPQAGPRKPIVVFNCTRRCNLACAHCYSASNTQATDDELTDAQVRAMIDDLAAYQAPVLLFSGGEPMARPGVMDLIRYASQTKLRTVISTNGTLIDAARASQLAQAGVAYVGVSVDGLRTANDAFRGRPGAFDAAMAGIRNCHGAGVKVGLRLTLNARNVDQLDGIFDLIEQEGIRRVCFYHLVYAGRAQQMRADSLTHAQTRGAVDKIIDRTADLHRRGQPTQVLTVDNHADGPYLYLRLMRQDPARAAQALALLKANGGNGTGQTISCVSWNGDVLPDQFWRQHVLGNVLQRPFSQIWSDQSTPLLAALRNRKDLLTGRCRRCRFMPICNGNFRARGEADSGQPWGDDGACYLSDDEIAGEAI